MTNVVIDTRITETLEGAQIVDASPDAPIHPIEATPPATDPLALDPLSPIARPRSIRWFRPAH
jgi:hypothetical protein